MATAGARGPCWFFNHATCKNSDADCRFAHIKVSEEEKKKMVKPSPRSPSPRRTPRGGGSPAAGGPSAAGGANNNTNPQPTLHCFKFIKGTCDKGSECAFAHISADVVKELKKAQANAKAKAKAKAKTKATVINQAPGIVNMWKYQLGGPTPTSTAVAASTAE